MKTCKVIPERSYCSACIETQMMFDTVDDCSQCKLNNREYELVSVGTGFWSGDYAMVQYNGKITRVPLSYVRDVKEANSFDQDNGKAD